MEIDFSLIVISQSSFWSLGFYPLHLDRNSQCQKICSLAHCEVHSEDEDFDKFKELNEDQTEKHNEPEDLGMFMRM